MTEKATLRPNLNLMPEMTLEHWDAVGDHIKRAALQRAVNNYDTALKLIEEMVEVVNSFVQTSIDANRCPNDQMVRALAGAIDRRDAALSRAQQFLKEQKK